MAEVGIARSAWAGPRLPRLAPLLVAGAVLFAYHNSFSGPFVFDDGPSIQRNPYIRHLLPLANLLRAPPDSAAAGRPLVSLSLALNYAVGGLQVTGYHAVNLAVHLLAALVLYGVVRRTLLARDQAATGLGLAIGLLWAVHPLLTEGVDYLSQRSESLASLFYLLVFYNTIRGRAAKSPGGWYALAVGACFLGMTAKLVVVSAPLSLLIYDRIFLATTWRQMLRERKWLYAGLLASWLLVPVCLVAGDRAATGATATTSLLSWQTVPQLGHGAWRVLDLTFRSADWWSYLQTQCGVIAHYLRLCFWPQPLVIDYFDWPLARHWRDVWLGALVVAALLGGTVWGLRQRWAVGALGAWFFLFLAPTTLVPLLSEVAAERRMYLPLAAVVTAVVLGVHESANRLGRHWGVAPRVRQRAMIAATGLLVMVLATLTIARNRDYRSQISILADAVAKRPQNPRARYNLAHALVDAGRFSEAIPQFMQELKLKPDDAGGLTELGSALATVGRSAEAIICFSEALRLDPGNVAAHFNLGMVLLQQGREEDALGQFQEVVHLAPQHAKAHYQLGQLLASRGRYPEAIAHYRYALQLRPNDAAVRQALALAIRKETPHEVRPADASR